MRHKALLYIEIEYDSDCIVAYRIYQYIIKYYSIVGLGI